MVNLQFIVYYHNVRFKGHISLYFVYNELLFLTTQSNFFSSDDCIVPRISLDFTGQLHNQPILINTFSHKINYNKLLNFSVCVPNMVAVRSDGEISAGFSDGGISAGFSDRGI